MTAKCLQGYARAGAMILCLLIALVQMLPAAAEEGTDTKTVRLGYLNMKGYEEGGEGEYKTGFSYEYFQRVSYYTGWHYEYVYGSFGDLITQLENGEIDLLGGVNYTQERAQKMLYSVYPQSDESFYLLSKSGKENPIEDDNQRTDGIKIGVMENTFQAQLTRQYLEENNITAEIIELDNDADVAAALEAETVNAAVLSDSQDYGFKPQKMLGSYDYYVAVNKNRPDLQKELNDALRMMRQNDSTFGSSAGRKYSYGMRLNSYLSDEETDWLEQHNNTIRVGYLGNNMPYSGIGENGEVIGVLSVVLNSLAERYGINIETKAFDSLEIMGDAMFAHEIDCYGPAIGDFYITELFRMIQTEPIVTTTPVLLYKGELSTQKIAVTEKSVFCQHVTGILYPEAEIYMCETAEDCMKAIANGEADCMVVTSGELNVLRKYEAMEKLSYTEMLKETQMCLFANLGDTELFTILNKAINFSATQLKGATFVIGANSAHEQTLREFVRDRRGYIMAGMAILAVILASLLISARRSERRAKIAKVESQNKSEELSLMNKALEERVRMLRALSRLFFANYYIDMTDLTYTEIAADEQMRKMFGAHGTVKEAVAIICDQLAEPAYAERMKAFLDPNTIDERMKGRQSISMEYYSELIGWTRTLLVEGDRDADGKLKHVFYVSRSIRDEKEMQAARLKAEAAAVRAQKAAEANAQLAEHDSLTGILNRTAYDRITEHLRESKDHLALLIVDVDMFKNVNDSYGHEAGDTALKKVATLLRENFRNEDDVFRYGGDEFMVLMKGIEADSRGIIVDKIDHINEILAKDRVEGMPRLSISAGVAFSDHGFAEEVFRRADEALYRRKEQGRSGCCFADEPD